MELELELEEEEEKVGKTVKRTLRVKKYQRVSERVSE